MEVASFSSSLRPHRTASSHYSSTVSESRPGGLAGILAAVRQHWIPALIAFLVVFVPAGFLIVTQKNDYSSQAVVGLVPVRSMSDSFLRSVAQQLPTYLTSPEVTARVGQKTGLTPKDVERAVTIEIPSATLNMDITAQSADSQTAAQIANEMANEALADNSYKEFFTPRLLSPAVPAERPTGLSRGILLAAAFLVAVVVAAVVALLARDLSGAKPSTKQSPTAQPPLSPGAAGPP